MIAISSIILIFLFHWIGDFIFQTDEQAKGKSKSNKALLGHTATYAAVWAVGACFLVPFINILPFVGITFVAHTIQDYLTSRLNSKLYAKGDTHNFFVSIGFDQILHYVQLILTFLWLS